MERNPRLLALKVGIILININPYPRVEAIPPPAGFHRLPGNNASFTTWLRNIPLRRDRTVYLYNGRPKRNQEAQFAVLDVSVGNKDLQQCADAVMRLRAEFLYSRKSYRNIDFYTGQGVRLNFLEWANGGRVRLRGGQLIHYTVQKDHRCGDNRCCFDDFLQTVFSYCGTLSLERQLEPVGSFGSIQPGDVLIKGGAPGHAMLVMDVAEDAAGHKVYLLAQSYMPAQDIHIVNNPQNKMLSPWYPASAVGEILTPEWIFYSNQLRRWSHVKL